MQRTNIYLEAEQARALNRLAESQGTSRAEVIRRMLDRALRGEAADSEADLAAIAASAGALADSAPVQRGSDRRSEHLEQMWGLDRRTGVDR